MTDGIIDGLRALAVPIETVQADPRNAREHPDENLEAIKASLLQYGQRRPIVVNSATQMIEAGNGVWQAAVDLGWAMIAAVYVTDDEVTAKAFGIMDNRSAELSTWNLGTLKELLEELDTGDMDMALTGFSTDAIRDLMTQVHQGGGGKTDPDDVPEDVESICQTGDIWVLGSHRLMCGDVTDASAIMALMDGKKAAMAFTDPPYGLSYEQDYKDGDERKAARRSGARGRVAMSNDDRADDASLRDFLTTCLTNMTAHLTGAVYMCYGAPRTMPCLQAWEEAGLHLGSLITWVKDRFVLGRRHYHAQSEGIVYGWMQKTGSGWQGGRDQSNVWEFKRPGRSDLHPTMKPVALCEKAIANSSKAGAGVVDFFGGSGSTLIACENLGRCCYTMDIDPRCCDVIIKRWEDYTGQKAEKIDA